MTVNGMNLHIGCHLGNSVTQSVHAVALVEPHSSLQDTIVE